MRGMQSEFPLPWLPLRTTAHQSGVNGVQLPDQPILFCAVPGVPHDGLSHLVRAFHTHAPVVDNGKENRVVKYAQPAVSSEAKEDSEHERGTPGCKYRHEANGVIKYVPAEANREPEQECED